MNAANRLNNQRKAREEKKKLRQAMNAILKDDPEHRKFRTANEPLPALNEQELKKKAAQYQPEDETSTQEPKREADEDLECSDEDGDGTYRERNVSITSPRQLGSSYMHRSSTEAAERSDAPIYAAPVINSEEVRNKAGQFKDAPKYYRVIHGDPRPWKKHKVFDTDGYIQVNDQVCALFDEDFKYMGASKLSPLILSKFGEGYEFKICQREVQIVEAMSPAEFNEGRTLAGEKPFVVTKVR